MKELKFMEKLQLDLAIYRLEKAEGDLDSAELEFNNNKFSQSINRSYYSMFHTVRSLLALDKFDSKKHSGVISYFNMHYVKSGKIETEYSKMLSIAFRIRNKSDYNDFFIATREEAEVQLENAKKFLKRIQEFIKELKETGKTKD
jgi:uncharacterized protein